MHGHLHARLPLLPPSHEPRRARFLGDNGPPRHVRVHADRLVDSAADFRRHPGHRHLLSVHHCVDSSVSLRHVFHRRPQRERTRDAEVDGRSRQQMGEACVPHEVPDNRLRGSPYRGAQNRVPQWRLGSRRDHLGRARGAAGGKIDQIGSGAEAEERRVVFGAHCAH